MPQLDISTYPSQVFWLAVMFGVLFLIMWRIVGPRIADTLESRQTRISDNLDRAAEFKKEADAAIEAYEASLAEARAEAQAMIAKANAELAAEAQEREAELASAINAKVAESEAEIAKAVEGALDSVNDVAREVAGAAVERLIGETADATDIAAAVDGAAKARG